MRSLWQQRSIMSTGRLGYVSLNVNKLLNILKNKSVASNFILKSNQASLSEPMSTHCQLEAKEHIKMKFYVKFIRFQWRKCIWECLLQNVGHFVSASLHKQLSASRKQFSQKPNPSYWNSQFWYKRFMMTSSNGNFLRVTGPLWGESTGHRWIPFTKASDAVLWCFLWSVSEQTVEQTIETLVIWDAIALIMAS